MGSDMGDDDTYTKSLGRWSVVCYGTGHMLNDITASCWFTYLLLFLTDIGLSPRSAAIVMLSGQIADGLATIFAGELIDRFGHFKIWHAAGSILVAISFSSVFGDCFPCWIFGTNSLTVQTIGYSVFAAIFNVGWAATQVSHMSMINCITLNSSSRVVLASCRNAFTMVANLSLYIIAIVVFTVTKADTHADIESQYRWIAYLSIFIGCCFVAIFHLGTKEPRLKRIVHGNGRARISWDYWFRKLLYYQVAVVYVLTRLVVNVSQDFQTGKRIGSGRLHDGLYMLDGSQGSSLQQAFYGGNKNVNQEILRWHGRLGHPSFLAYLAFYVINDLRMAQSAKALVPAIIYICSFIVSIILQEISWTGRRIKAYYCAGGILWIFCGAVIFLLPRNMSSIIYSISVIIGIANALMMVTGVSMQSVLVGEDLSGCAFVCGSLSFMDKISCGIALYILQSYQNTDTATEIRGTIFSDVYLSVSRFGLGLVPAFCSLAGVAITYTMKLNPYASKPILEPLLE